MNDFSNMSSLEVKGDETVDFQMFALEGEPIIKLHPATEANRPYYSALLKLSTRLAKQLRGREASVKTLVESRQHDATLFPVYVIQGWDEKTGPIGGDGKRVPFTQKDAESFIQALCEFAPDEFDAMRNYASQNANFRKGSPTAEDAAALGES